MFNLTKGQLIELCQMVNRGAKPCALMTIKDKDLGTAEDICTTENCKYKATVLDDGWVSFWIYKRDELSAVIDCLPATPENYADHYLLGALFGYSNDAICDYLNKT